MATIDSTGFTARTQTEILESLESRQLSDIDPNLDVSAESPIGQLNGVFSRELALLEQLLETAYDSHDPDKAVGAALTALCKITGTARRAADYTTVSLTCDLDSATTLESGTHFAEVAGNPDSRWTPVDDYTATASGSQSVPFRAENTGPISVAENSITVISTAVTGWNSVNNPSVESVGRDADDDPTLRTRRDADVAKTGSATVAAIRADVLAADASIIDVSVFTNRSDDTDSNGLPPHSVEVLVFDGTTPSASDTAIAQAIYDTVGSGVTIYGTGESGTATDPDTGESVSVDFSRPTTVSIYIDIDVTVDGDYDSDANFKTWLAAQANSLVTVGRDVYWRQIDSLAFSYPGVVNVTAFAIDDAASPMSAADVIIDTREIAYFDASNITVTST